MKRHILINGLVSGLFILAVYFLFTRPGSDTYAQIQNPQSTIDETSGLSKSERALVERIKAAADKIELSVTGLGAKWKLEKKFAGQTSSGTLPLEKGGGTIFGTSAYLRFSKKDLAVDIDLNLEEPSTDEDVSERLKFGTRGISRGIVNRVEDIGEEAVIISDAAESPSKYVYVSFRRDKFLVTVGANSRFQNRSITGGEARKIAKIVDLAIQDPPVNTL